MNKFIILRRKIAKLPISPLIKKPIKKGLLLPRLVTSSIRMMPGFIIIGAQRCGTTSLYNYLVMHPSVLPAFTKEVHYFDLNFYRGSDWYRAHFPCSLRKYYNRRIFKTPLITGEASPYYIYHPHTPNRMFQLIPGVKLLVLLRNPVDRAYSHYHHEVRLGIETLSFKEAIKKEEERLSGEVEKMLKDENYNSFNHQHYSYLSRGIYIEQLKVWMDLFPRNQILILRSEDFYNNTSTVWDQVLNFLNLPSSELPDFRKYNYGNYPRLDAAMREHLIKYFKPFNEQLYEYLGMDLGWDR